MKEQELIKRIVQLQNDFIEACNTKQWYNAEQIRQQYNVISFASTYGIKQLLESNGYKYIPIEFSYS